MTTDSWSVRHARDVDAALASRDSASIKRLYIDLGSFMEDDYGDDPTAVPLLSFPQTGPVVCRMLDDTDGRLLDAGCGPNPATAIALAGRPTRTVVALDIGLGTVRLARARANASGVTLLAVVGDLEALPFRAGAFAGGVCDDTIEHVPDDARGARELTRVLSHDGRMVVATPNRRRLGVVLRRARDRMRGRRLPAHAYYAAESHLREYTWRELIGLLSTDGVVTRRATVGWSGSRARSLASRLVAFPGMRGVSQMLVVVVTPRA